MCVVNIYAMGTPALYKEYVKHNYKNPVSYKEFQQVLVEWGTTVCNYLLEGKTVQLPKRMSSLLVVKKIKKRYVDYKESKIQKKKVYKSNVHSGFFGARIFWKSHYASYALKGWEFRPHRNLSRALAGVMNTPGEHRRYMERVIATTNVGAQKSVYAKTIFKL